MKEIKTKSVQKRCPRCETRVRFVVGRCPECGMKLHTSADCKGCGGVDKEGACLAYRDKDNPILNPNGTCYTRKKLWS
jgi:predicted amidophosphoribosyltransferase